MRHVAIKGRLGASVRDMIIGLALLSVVAALSYPTLRARAFRAQVQAVILDVEDLRSSAEQYLDQTGRWPDADDAAARPPIFGTLLADDERALERGYLLEWSVWSFVEPSEVADAPRSEADETETIRRPTVVRLATVSVHSRDMGLLGELLQVHGRDLSFVRDTTWTLMLSRSAEAEAPGG